MPLPFPQSAARPPTSARPCTSGLGARRRQGFALIITIILMSMLVLLMVSMATLTRVETQIAANFQQADAARHNALTALNIALGQLQAAAGPDQRVTARAEILDSNASTAAVDSVNQPYWTAAWTTGNATLDTGGSPQRLASLGALNPTPKQRNDAATAWLVSKPTATTALDARTYTGTTTGTAPDAVVLARQIGPKNGGIANDVTVPLVPLTVPANKLPGFASTDSTPITLGSYGYWVADEGVKAKINLAPNAASAAPGTSSSDRTQNQRHFLAPATWAAEQALDSSYRSAFLAFDSSLLTRVLQPASTALVTSSTFIKDTAGFPVSQVDITTDSMGVLADVRNGGLKKDLTAALENQAQFTTLMSRYANDDGAGSKLWTAPGVATLGTTLKLDGLRWPSLWFHYNIYKSSMPAFRSSPAALGTAPVGIGDPTVATPSINPRIHVLKAGTQTVGIDGLAARLLAFKLEVGVSTVAVPGGYQLRLHYFPTLILYNPYNVRLNTSGSLQYVMQCNPFGTGTSDRCTIQRASDGKILMDSNLGGYVEPTLLSNTGIKPGNYFVTMYTKPADSSFEPGEIKIFGLGSTSPSAISTAGLSNTSPNPRIAAYTFIGSGNVADPTQALTTTFASGNYQYVDVPLPSSTTLAGTDTLEVKINAKVRCNTFNFGVRGVSRWPDSNPSTTYPNDYPSQNNLQADNALFMAAVMDTGASGSQSVVWSGTPASLNAMAAGGSIQRIGALIVRVKGTSPATATMAIPTQGGSSSVLNSLHLNHSYLFLDVSNTAGTTISSANDLQRDPLNTTRSVWGRSDAGRAGGSSLFVLKELPLQPMISLGQFMHMSPAYHNTAQAPGASVGQGAQTFSLYPVGGSLPSPLLTDLTTTSQLNTNSNLNPTGLFTDDQYLNNEALFDTFFFSTIPPDLTTTALPTGTVTPSGWSSYDQAAVDAGTALLNPRHRIARSNAGVTPALADLRDMDKAAGGLLVEGAFNVNSTSIPAWRAVLASLRYTSQPTDKHPFTRITSSLTAVPTADDFTTGVRVLSDSQLNDLANAIVEQVKTRGPFLSMADFVNRRLVAGSLGQKGALQAAIEASGINTTALTSGLGGVTTNFSPPSSYGGSYPPVPVATANFPANTAEGAPGCITQTDLLQALAPLLTVRSDTFTVRTYGEVRNPQTQAVVSKAWCEAVVQRLPEYLINKTASASTGNDPAETPTAGSVNALFGRKFKIVSFRWLTPNDL
jgi:hypothetical protein